MIKIGLAGPFQGEYRYVGYDAIFGARLALREANVAGGVAGYNVELVAYDDEGTAAGALRAAQNLDLDSQVVAVVGHFRRRPTLAAQPVYTQAGLALVVAGTVEGWAGAQAPARLFCPLLDYLAHAMEDQSVQADAAPPAGKVQWMPGDLVSAGEIEGIKQACDSDVSLEISAQLPPSPDVLAVILPMDPLAAGEAAAALRAAGWTGYLAGGPGLASPLFSQIAGPVDVIVASPFRWPDVNGEDAEFRTAYKALGPHVPEPGPFALSTYQAVQAVLQAIGTVHQRGEAVGRSTVQHVLTSLSAGAVFIYRRRAGGEMELIAMDASALRSKGTLAGN